MSSAMYLALLIWLGLVGGCVGSFLNVVVYRLPRGMSIVRPGSHCPRCKTPIRAWDNVPVLAWLWLRGRCRHCGGRISVRYPLVELVMAVLFVWLAAVEPLSGGANLPPTLPESPVPDWLLWVTYATHMVLLSSLLAAALIEWDAQRVPLSLFAPAMLAGVVARSCWAELRTLPMSLAAAPEGWEAGVRASLSDLAAVALLAIATWPLRRAAWSRRGWAGAVGAMVAIGVQLSWQAAALVACASLLVWWLVGLAMSWIGSASAMPGWIAWQTVGAALLLAGWRWLGEQAGWLWHEGGGGLWAIAFGMLGLWSILVRLSGRRSHGGGPRRKRRVA